MKFLRILLIIILVVIAGFLVLGLIAPKDIVSERSVIINAPQPVVANEMFHFANFKDWSPFQKYDPDMKTRIEGEDGQMGSGYYWDGNDDVGKGNMQVTKRTNEELVIDLNFEKPWQRKSIGMWKVEDAGNNQSKATWKLTMHEGYPMNGMMWVMSKLTMGKMFDEGLNNLKKIVEGGKVSMPTSSGNFNIEETQFVGGNFAAIRKTMAFDEMDKFFKESYETLAKSAGNRINGKALGFFYKWDEENRQADCAAAFPVKGTEPVENAIMINLPASKAYKIVYKGGYSGSYAAHMALSKEVESKGLKQNLVVEEYIMSPADTKDSNAFVTNIYYLIP